MEKMVWREGKPDREGWWWLLAAPDFARHLGTGAPAMVQIKRQGDVTPGKPELYLQLRDGRLEAWLFEGLVAGPIPEPVMPGRGERLGRERAWRGGDRPRT